MVNDAATDDCNDTANTAQLTCTLAKDGNISRVTPKRGDIVLHPLKPHLVVRNQRGHMRLMTRHRRLMTVKKVMTRDASSKSSGVVAILGTGTQSTPRPTCIARRWSCMP
jgi:hypothetical protein